MHIRRHVSNILNSGPLEVETSPVFSKPFGLFDAELHECSDLYREVWPAAIGAAQIWNSELGRLAFTQQISLAGRLPDCNHNELDDREANMGMVQKYSFN